MTKPNFDAMSIQELHTYVLEHRDDVEAFYAYVDKLHAQATWIEMPPLQSLDDLQNYPEFIKKLSNGSEFKDSDRL